MMVATLNGLQDWLQDLAQRYNLIAPCNVDGHALYRPVASGDEVLLDYERPELSAKDYFLPATEILLQVEQQGGQVIQEETLPDRKQVIFGLRPCDAHGLAAIDALFLKQDPVDRNYAHHRARTVLLGLACPQMWDGCFCTSVGGAPDDPTHLDVLFREVSGGYAVEVVTEKASPHHQVRTRKRYPWPPPRNGGRSLGEIRCGDGTASDA